MVLDSDQRVICWNYWFASASNISSERAIGKTISELFPGHSLARLTTSISEAFNLGSSALLTHSLNPNLLPLRTRAGLPLVHNVSVRPLGERPYSHCVLQIADVTGAAHREQVLRERQNARYDAVVESAPDIILTLDATGIIQFANPTAIRETQFERSELVGRALGSLFERPDQWENLWQTILAGDQSARPIELVARRKDGSRTFLDVSASRWLSEGRVFVTAILRDMNERRAAEEALRELNLTLEHRVAERTQERDRIWQVSLDMLGVAAADGTWISVNPAWTMVLGWLPDEIEARLRNGSSTPTTAGKCATRLVVWRFQSRRRILKAASAPVMETIVFCPGRQSMSMVYSIASRATLRSNANNKRLCTRRKTL